ncbi:hypothetical protein ACF07Y_39000 [Streptomyces sp. NPDC016566]|uniref:hypothetical protein n=1 Tax=Streptomyces sp. NPDC016566 TaxID=3364967 RepID=UPI00370207AF
MTGPRAKGRYAREQLAQDITTTLTAAGWTVEARGTESLHATPPSVTTPPADASVVPMREPELVPAEVIDSIHQVVAYNWTTERRDYAEQHPDDRKGHIANHLNRIARHWNLCIASD